MNVLGEFIQQQMDARGWKQVDLVRASGLTKQVVSHLLRRDVRRMIEPGTIAGLARAFGLDEWEIRLKAAEAAGLPVAPDTPLYRAAHDEPSEALLRILLQREENRRRGVRNGTAASTSGLETPSESVPAPNQGSLGSVAGEGGGMVSGEKSTSGDLRDPRRQSRGSDETEHDNERPWDTHPHLL